MAPGIEVADLEVSLPNWKAKMRQFVCLSQEIRTRRITSAPLAPATGAEMKVGDVQVTEANIHAGAKYMDQLIT